MPKAFSRFNTFGSFRDHAFPLEYGFWRSLPSLLAKYPGPVRLNSSSVHAFDETTDREGRNRRELCFHAPESPFNCFWRLIVHELCFNETAELCVKGNLLACFSVRSHTCSGEMFGVCRVVYFPLPFLLQFIPKRALGSPKRFGDLPERIPSCD